MVEFIIGTFIVILIRNRIVKNINNRAGIELYSIYSIKSIFTSWQIYLPLFFACVYIGLEICVFQRNYWFIPYQKAFKDLTLLSYLPLIFKYKLYESAWIRLRPKHYFINIITSPMFIGMLLIVMGTILNLIAIKVNNGFMPVFPSLTYETGYMDRNMFNDGLHILGEYNTNMIWACDIFDLFGYSVASIGDIFVRTYASIIIFFSIKNNSSILLK